MKLVRKFLLYIYILFVWFLSISSFVIAAGQTDDILNLKIVPSVKNDWTDMNNYINIQKWNDFGEYASDWKWNPLKAPTSFWYKYQIWTEKLQKNNDLWWEIQWWFININTILTFLAYIIRLMSNVAIAAGAFFVVKGGYEYAMQTFGGKTKTTEYIKNVVMWIFIMSFAYGFIKILSFTFLE